MSTKTWALPDASWSGRAAAVTNQQILETLNEHPGVRDFVVVGERIAAETGMIKTAAGAASYLVEHANTTAGVQDWFDRLVDGAGLGKGDPRLVFRNTMQRMARKQAGQVQRRRDTREHVTLYLKAFNAWAAGQNLQQLRFTPREPLPPITRVPEVRSAGHVRSVPGPVLIDVHAPAGSELACDRVGVPGGRRAGEVLDGGAAARWGERVHGVRQGLPGFGGWVGQ